MDALAYDDLHRLGTFERASAIFLASLIRRPVEQILAATVDKGHHDAGAMETLPPMR
jgi:hypothetical protein